MARRGKSLAFSDEEINELGRVDVVRFVLVRS
jgi:hypothetical protein